ncbi:SRPBCC domain-containing protein [Humibacter sp. RRB41]|uniref:SRPBCC domain-containing protein n=1 Tax=Humibacter sp. RRB41 TaxID=2919946 RepID=UPI001FA97E43|nr:SRPBCC domain-containing protein [Humibacter sp. RRB41]
MEYGSIEREIYVDASPEIVFEVVSRPEHLREWWPDDADLDPVPGGTGELRWGEHGGEPMVVPMTVVEADSPRKFSFRWAYPLGTQPERGNSFLVTFELTPAGDGTTVRMTEVGFREQGWEVAVLESAYLDHVAGWDRFIPQLAAYAPRVVAAP